jgi:hypothetical protein
MAAAMMVKRNVVLVTLLLSKSNAMCLCGTAMRDVPCPAAVRSVPAFRQWVNMPGGTSIQSAGIMATGAVYPVMTV